MNRKIRDTIFLLMFGAGVFWAIDKFRVLFASQDIELIWVSKIFLLTPFGYLLNVGVIGLSIWIISNEVEYDSPKSNTFLTRMLGIYIFILVSVFFGSLFSMVIGLG